MAELALKRVSVAAERILDYKGCFASSCILITSPFLTFLSGSCRDSNKCMLDMQFKAHWHWRAGRVAWRRAHCLQSGRRTLDPSSTSSPLVGPDKSFFLSKTHSPPRLQSGRTVSTPLNWMSHRTTVCKLPGIGRTQDLTAVIGSNCRMVKIVRVRFLTKNCTSKSPGITACSCLLKNI